MAAKGQLIDGEPLDHELHRIPVTKSMKDGVKAAAAADMTTPSAWLRRVVAKALAQQ